MASLFLDFESFSACPLRTAGTAAYARHPTTAVILACAAIDDGPVVDLDPLRPLPDAIARFWRDGVGTTWAWNAFFERLITEHRWPYAWGHHKPQRWQCSMALAASCSLPLPLATCSAWLFPNDPSRQKDRRGTRLIQLCCIPDKEGKRPILAPELFQELLHYCRQDVVTERAVHHALPVRCLSPVERDVWALDQRINLRGFQVDVPLVQGALFLADRETLRINKELRKLTGGAVTTAKQNAKIVAYCREAGADLDNVRADTVLWALREPGLPGAARKVLELRQEGSLQSLRKLPPVLRMQVGHRLYGTTQYHAAHTGRWGGRGFQPHNLTKPRADRSHLLEALREEDDDLIRVMTGSVNLTIRDCMRHVITAAPGKTLVACDINAIEARVAGWVAGDEHYNTAFRDGLDLYRLTASPIYGIPYEDIPNPSLMRDIGKKCALGLQYGMGWNKFYESCVKEGLDVTEALCKKAVKIYRKTAAGIMTAGQWAEKMVIRAIKKPGQMICPSEHWAKIRLYAIMQDGYLCIHLPSGRLLRYPKPSIRTLHRVDQESGRTYTREQACYWRAYSKGVIHVSTYSGKIFENTIQAIARDVLAYSMLNIDPHYPIVLHVHDEAVCEVPTVDGPACLAHMQKWLSTAPPWAPGLALKCGGFISPFYRK